MSTQPFDTDTIDNRFERIANRFGWSEAERSEFGATPERRAFIVEHERLHALAAQTSHPLVVELAPNPGS